MLENQVIMTAIQLQQSFQSNKLFVSVKAQGFFLSNNVLRLKLVKLSTVTSSLLVGWLLQDKIIYMQIGKVSAEKLQQLQSQLLSL